MVGSIPRQVALPVKLSDAVLRRGGRRILGPLSFALNGQGISILVGPNGAGKTSLLRVIHGLDSLSDGTIRFSCDSFLARSFQSFVFQTPVTMRRTVSDSIAYPLHLDGVGRRIAREWAAAMAERVGLDGKLDRDSRFLSGGEKQKLTIARALIRDPQLLLLDEPCANLDGRATRDIEAILLEARAEGKRIVMSTHDVGQARRLADEVLFLHEGRLLAQARGSEFFDSPPCAQAEAWMNGEIVL